MGHDEPNLHSRALMPEKSTGRATPCTRCGEVCRDQFATGKSKLCLACKGTATQKRCTKCGKLKARTRATFSPRPRNKDGLASVCRQCVRDGNKVWWEAKGVEYTHANKALIVSSQRGWHLKANYDLTVDEYAAILVAQGGVCAICGGGARTYHVDHCHKTGIIRGLACHRCNTKLLVGCKDSIDVLRAAIAYLESPPAQAVVPGRVVPADRPADKRGRRRR